MPDDPTLESLTRARFGELSKAEIRFARAAPTGELAVCGPNMDDADPANDPSKADADWKEDRTIRAALIRWVCVDRRARDLVDPLGIQIYGARIGDALDLSSAAIPFALTLWKCRLTGETNLRDTAVAFLGFHGSWVDSIAADRVTVKSAVVFRSGFHAARGVRLPGAQIGDDLSCTDSTFDSAPEPGTTGSRQALNMEGAIVGDSVFLGSGFKAEGEVRLVGAKIGGDLDCIGATFAGTLRVQRASIKGGLHWYSINVPPKPAPIGASRDTSAVPSSTVDSQVILDLIGMSVDSLADDRNSWPARGNLALDGFIYRRFSGPAPKDSASRLDWLDRQPQFKPQPYRQVAKVLREEGDAAGARRVLFEMERLRRREEKRMWVPPVRHGLLGIAFSRSWHNMRRLADYNWDTTLRWTIGYGYYPGRALAWLLLIVVVGWPVFRRGYFSWYMAPTEHYPPAHYERFSALAYSFENSFPLIKLGQVNLWQPNSPPQAHAPQNDRCSDFLPGWVGSREFLEGFGYFQIISGWFLATMGVAGITGIVRKED